MQLTIHDDDLNSEVLIPPVRFFAAGCCHGSVRTSESSGSPFIAKQVLATDVQQKHRDRHRDMRAAWKRRNKQDTERDL